MNVTTIQLEKKLVRKLQRLREYPRQTYNDLLSRMIIVFEGAKKRNQYDEFLHKIQQPAMKELWDNKDDEAWQNA